MTAVLTGFQWHHEEISIYVLLMVKDIEHILKLLSVISCFLKKNLFNLLVHLLMVSFLTLTFNFYNLET